MRFSIVVPAYRTEPYFGQCVESILAQTFRDFELILVDNASPDGIPEMCDRYAKSEGRVRVRHLEENAGISGARNLGIAMSAGEYLIFCDSDDFILEPDALEALSSVIDGQGLPDVVIFDSVEYAGPQGPLRRRRDSFASGKAQPAEEAVVSLIARHRFGISSWAKAVRADFLRRIEGTFIPRRLEDLDWSMKLYLNASRIAEAEGVTYAHRVHPHSASRSVHPLSVYTDSCFVVRKWADFIRGSGRMTERAKTLLLGYLAYQYYIILATGRELGRAEYRQVLAESEDLRWLTRYSCDLKTWTCGLLHRVLGPAATGKLLLAVKKTLY